MVRPIACRCIAVGIGVASVAGAQTPAQPLQLADRGPAFYEVRVSDGARVDARHAAMLTQRILLRLHDATIPDALVVIGEQAGLRFTYDQSVLPANTRVSLHADDITVAAALTQVLLDANLDIEITPTGLASLVRRAARASVAKQQAGTVTGHISDAATHRPIPYATVGVEDTKWGAIANDSGVYHITGLPSGTYTVLGRSLGYAPLRHTTTLDGSQSLTLDFALTKSPNQLEHVVVTGTVAPTAIKAIPTPISIVTDSDIAAQRPRTTAQIFRQAVPSAVAWDFVNTPEQTAFSLRGTSTLSSGDGTVKVYLDGVPLSNLTFAPVDPNSIDHIEVLRGPEAATIYGSDAIGGVMAIFTKHGDPNAVAPHIDLSAALGVLQSPYSGYSGAARQEYTGAIWGGTPAGSYNIGAGYTDNGAWAPEAQDAAPSLYGATHFSQGWLGLDVSARYYQLKGPEGVSPDFARTGLTYWTKPGFTQFLSEAQTYGAHLSATPTPWWTNNVVVGVDRFSIDAHQTQPRFTFATDTERTVEDATGTRVSLAYNSALRFTLSPDLTTTATVGVDGYRYAHAYTYTTGAFNTTGTIVIDATQPPVITRDLVNDIGYFAQLQVNVRDALFLTAGLRAEHNTEFGDSLGTQVSPRAGAAYIHNVGDVTLKVRGSYGEAIRPPSPGQKDARTYTTNIVLASPSLGPERQAGWDAGLDATIGGTATLGVTYYHQVARNLIDYVLVDGAAIPPVYQYQNIGRFLNQGIELEGTLSLATAARLHAQYAFTRSHAEALGAGYSGDLRLGEQNFDVPRSTAGLSVEVTAIPHTSVAFGATYVGDWVDYNFLAEFSCYGGTGPCAATTRGYLMTYPAFTKVHLSVTRDITPVLSAFLSVDNLFNDTHHEFEDFSPILGRQSMIGLRFSH
jgi:outer membrane receptor protein involved in Fe transport